MAALRGASVGVLLVLARAASVQALNIPGPPPSCSAGMRKGLSWGLATSSYQIEGGWNAAGRSKSIWDTFSQAPGNVHLNQNGNVAVDHYHRFKEDVAIMKKLGLKFYRLSISWPRVLPQGSAGTAPNMGGIWFYQALCKELRAAGILPVITLYHWDLPQVLQDKYGGFLDKSGRFEKDFAYFADVTAKALSPYAVHFLTFNEPLSICQLGYGIGLFAPAISGQQYACGHNLLLAHAAAAKVLKGKYGKRVGMALSGHWGLPYSSSASDKAAAENFMVFQFGWMADPLYRGDYPPIMRTVLGGQLPGFSAAQKAAIKGSVDYFALNYYTSHYVQGQGPHNAPNDMGGSSASGQTPGPMADVNWLFVAPQGIQDTLLWIHRRYNGPKILITENGVAVPGEDKMSVAQATQDDFRLNYYRGYIDNVCQAIKKGVKVKGYFAWSLMDNFEWKGGYEPRFGVVHVDYKNGLKRTPKASALWFSKWFFKAQ